MTSGSRAAQRDLTRSTILIEAQRLFASIGFDRTSIRDVAAAANVDPALVLYHFGSKRSLFQQVLDGSREAENVPAGDPTEIVLAALERKLSAASDATLAHLRSMLTNDDARAFVRDKMEEAGRELAGRLQGDHALARAELLLAMNLGVVLARKLLQLEGVSGVSGDELSGMLRPGVQAIVEGRHH